MLTVTGGMAPLYVAHGKSSKNAKRDIGSKEVIQKLRAARPKRNLRLQCEAGSSRAGCQEVSRRRRIEGRASGYASTSSAWLTKA